MKEVSLSINQNETTSTKYLRSTQFNNEIYFSGFQGKGLTHHPFRLLSIPYVALPIPEEPLHTDNVLGNSSSNGAFQSLSAVPGNNWEPYQ